MLERVEDLEEGNLVPEVVAGVVEVEEALAVQVEEEAVVAVVAVAAGSGRCTLPKPSA